MPLRTLSKLRALQVFFHQLRAGSRFDASGDGANSEAEDRAAQPANSSPPNETYWSAHNVTLHRRFSSAEDSLDYFDWRNDQYPGYIELLPVHGRDGQVVLDYGCGPGNDLVGFSVHSKPKRLIGMDISAPSLEESRARLALHGAAAELMKIDEDAPSLPLPDESVDYVHCSGVLMCAKDPAALLREFKRILRPEGLARLMIYHKSSVWVHLYVAYFLLEQDSAYRGLSLEEAFQRSTDGPACPINRYWTVQGFLRLAEEAGFRGEHLGNAASLHELSLLGRRFEAQQSPNLPSEHRRFLAALRVDDRGIPYHEGMVAGINACFELRK